MGPMLHVGHISYVNNRCLRTCVIIICLLLLLICCLCQSYLSRHNTLVAQFFQYGSYEMVIVDQSDLDDARLKPLNPMHVLREDFFNTTNLFCRSPRLSIDSQDMWQIVKLRNTTRLDCGTSPNWIHVSNGTIRLSKHTIAKHGSIVCGYRPILRPTGEEFWVTSGDRHFPIPDKMPLVSSDLFVADCQANDGQKYSNVHMGIRFDNDLHMRHIRHPMIKTHLGYNILMFGFDSVSRLAFMRLLPQTYAYMINELGSIVMKGHNIVGDGTTPNLLALLTGHKIEELYEARRGKDKLTTRMMKWLPILEREFNLCRHGRNRTSLDFISYLMENKEYVLPQQQRHFRCPPIADLVSWIGPRLEGNRTRAYLLTLLTEYKKLQFPEANKTGSVQMIDRYPWIWKKFKDNGYVTQWVEDWQGIGSLTWRLNGFSDPPVDHYGRPFYLWTESRDRSNSDHCFGSISRFQSMLNWIRDLFDMYPSPHRPKFSFGFHKKYSHHSYDTLPFADIELRTFLKTMKERGELDHTILILMTDHGPRFAKTRSLYQGRLEERLPLMSIRMPTEFQIKYPEAMHNLRLNSHRLTTAFDVHETFLHMFEFHSFKTYQSKKKRATSLFQLIPETRTCADVGISQHLCACLDWQVMSPKDPIIVRFSHAAVRFFNQFMYINNSDSECAPLSLHNVREARVLIENKAWVKFVQTPDVKNLNRSTSRAYQIHFETVPGHGEFELTAEYYPEKDMFDIQRRHLSRINPYGDASSCIAEQRPDFREICYCSNLLNRTTIKDHKHVPFR